MKNKSVIWRNWRSKDNGVGDLGDLMWKSMKGERARIDKWFSPYVGKLYSDNCTEVFSMGLQNFVSESTLMSFAKKDFDHFSFIVGVINGFI